jgi:hypothetical protein
VERTYFTDAEARTEVGNIVEALSDFPSVPKGSKGTVVKVKRYAKDKWTALVEWDLPRQSSFIAAMVLDASSNFSVLARMCRTVGIHAAFISRVCAVVFWTLRIRYSWSR